MNNSGVILDSFRSELEYRLRFRPGMRIAVLAIFAAYAGYESYIMAGTVE